MTDYSALIQTELGSLSPAQQQEVLALVRTLQTSGKARPLAELAGAIPQADLSVMQQAIQEGCEQVDPGEW